MRIFRNTALTSVILSLCLLSAAGASARPSRFGTQGLRTAEATAFLNIGVWSRRQVRERCAWMERTRMAAV